MNDDMRELKAAKAAERERCAKVADEYAKTGMVTLSTPAAIAAAIRALGN